MYLERKRLFSDPPVCPAVPAFCDPLNVISHGFHIYGEIYVPSGDFSGKRPCVCLLHGFPGTTVNDDLAQALRRIGCVVLRFFHRGSWGSEGFYSFTNNIEDAVAVADWAVGEGAARYPIDPKRVFLVGHSVGGQTALHAARRLPWVRGTALLAPNSVSRMFREHREEELRNLLREGYFLRTESPDSLYKNAEAHLNELNFEAAVPELLNRNLLMIGGKLDVVAPVEQMIMPLWNQLKPAPASARHDLSFIGDGHSFCSSRIELTEKLGKWIAELCEC